METHPEFSLVVGVGRGRWAGNAALRRGPGAGREERSLGCGLSTSRVYKACPGGAAGKESACRAGDPGSIPGLGRSPAEGIGYSLQDSWASLAAQMVKNPPASRETWVRFLGWAYPLQYSSLENSMDREAWRATVNRVTKRQTQVSTTTSTVIIYSQTFKPRYSTQ